MTPDETEIALAHLASLDRAHTVDSEQQRAAKVASWCEVLHAVPLDAALAIITKAYSAPRPRPLQVGEVLRAYQDHDLAPRHDQSAREQRYASRARKWESGVDYDARMQARLRELSMDQATSWAVQVARAVLPYGASAGSLVRETLQTMADGRDTHLPSQW